MIDINSSVAAADAEKEHSPNWDSVWRPVSKRRYSQLTFTELPPWPDQENIIRHRALVGAGLGYISIKRSVNNGWVTETLVYKDKDFSPRECGG